MFVAVHHHSSRNAGFVSRVHDLIEELPSDLHLEQFVPSKEGDLAHSVWVAPSVDEVRDFLDGVLEEVSEQEYHEVDEKDAVGLARASPEGAQTASTWSPVDEPLGRP